MSNSYFTAYALHILDTKNCEPSSSLADQKIDSTNSQSSSNKCHQLAPFEKRPHRKAYSQTAHDDIRTVPYKSKSSYLQQNNSQSNDENHHSFNTQSKPQIYTNYTIDTNYSNDSNTHGAYYTDKRYHNETQEPNNFSNYQGMAMTQNFEQNRAATNNSNYCLSQQPNAGLARNIQQPNCHDQGVADEQRTTNLDGDNKSVSNTLAYQPTSKESYSCPANYTAISQETYDHEQ